MKSTLQWSRSAAAHDGRTASVGRPTDRRRRGGTLSRPRGCTVTEQLAFWGMPQRRRRPGRPSRRDNLQRALDILAVYQGAHGGPRPSAAAREPHMLWIVMGDEDWRDPM